jgi:hypothetical protein
MNARNRKKKSLLLQLIGSLSRNNTRQQIDIGILRANPTANKQENECYDDMRDFHGSTFLLGHIIDKVRPIDCKRDHD